MKKTLCLLLAMVLITALFTGCTPAAPESSDTTAPTTAPTDPAPIAETPVEPDVSTEPVPTIKTEVTPKSDWVWNGLYYGGNFTLIPSDEGRTDTVPAYWDLPLGTVAVSKYVQKAMDTYSDDTVVLVEVLVIPTLYLRGMSYEDDPEAWMAEKNLLEDEMRARLTAAGYNFCTIDQCPEAHVLERLMIFVSIGQLREFHCGDDVTVILSRGTVCVH